MLFKMILKLLLIPFILFLAIMVWPLTIPISLYWGYRHLIQK